MTGPRRPVRVLVIDDSASTRRAIARILDAAPGVEVVGRAAGGGEGLQEVHVRRPDVVTLDLEMPQMSGFAFLRLLMTRRPTPVVILSSHDTRTDVFKALELGAIDFVAKPTAPASTGLGDVAEELVDKVLAASRIQRVASPSPARATLPGGWHAEHLVAQTLGCAVCIAASTGGPPALRRIFAELPADLPAAVLISQHMPASFTGAFARRLDAVSPLRVTEARTGDRLEPGRALVAPGGGSIAVEDDLRVTVEPPDEPVAPLRQSRIAPSADRNMETAARAFGANVLGVVLTGMGTDGSRGVQAIRAAGGEALAESEESAVVYGMPAAALRTGAVSEVRRLSEIAASVVRFARLRADRRR